MTNTISKVYHNGTEYEFKDTTYSAGTGLSLSGTEFRNAGVTSFNGNTGPITYTAPVTSVNGKTGAVNLYSTIAVTLTASSRSNNAITVTATGVTASNTVVVSPDPTYMTDYKDADIYCSAQASNSLTFTCTTVPANDIVVNVLIMN